MKLGSVDPIIELDVPSDNSPIDSEMVETTPILNLNPQEESRLNYNKKLNMKSQKWNKLLPKKKSAI